MGIPSSLASICPNSYIGQIIERPFYGMRVAIQMWNRNIYVRKPVFALEGPRRRHGEEAARN